MWGSQSSSLPSLGNGDHCHPLPAVPPSQAVLCLCVRQRCSQDMMPPAWCSSDLEEGELCPDILC